MLPTCRRVAALEGAQHGVDQAPSGVVRISQAPPSRLLGSTKFEAPRNLEASKPQQEHHGAPTLNQPCFIAGDDALTPPTWRFDAFAADMRGLHLTASAAAVARA